MTKESVEKIDIFCHILPPKYKEALFKKSRPCYYLEPNLKSPALFDLDIRFRVMDKFKGLRQVLTVGAPPLEHAFSPKDAVELARMANDEMAELVSKYPDRFIAAVAALPLNDIDAALSETERTIEDLHFKGVQIFSSINGKPLDSPEFMALYDKMVQYDLPIWIHPAKERDIPDYPGEEASMYHLFVIFGWPYETTLAMSRLVFSGVIEKYPNIKFIAHHCGAMVPYFAKRLLGAGQRDRTDQDIKLTRPLLEYFKEFYTDTVLGGHTPGLMCGYDFYGSDHLLFGTDYPYPGGAEKGDFVLGEVIKSVEMMDVPENEKAKIFNKNARRILCLNE